MDASCLAEATLSSHNPSKPETLVDFVLPAQKLDPVRLWQAATPCPTLENPVRKGVQSADLHPDDSHAGHPGAIFELARVHLC